MNIRTQAAALGLAGALALVSLPASAGPLLPVGSATIKNATSDHVTDVRWRGRGAGPGIAFGLAAGALVGAAVASQPYGYGPGYYYDAPAPVYAAPYGYADTYDEPVYVAPPRYYGRRCFTDEGYGRRRPCSAN